MKYFITLMTTAHEHQWHDTCDVSFFGGKIYVSCLEKTRWLPVKYFVSSKGIFVHKYPLILRYNDWLVLEIITQWTGKTIL